MVKPRTKLADIEAAGERATAKGNTPRRNLRVDDNLWENYLSACVTHGTNASKAIRAFMRALVAGDPSAADILQHYQEGATDE